MQPYFRNEKRTVTPEKAQKILAKHGTVISLENAGIMLELLHKLSNLSVGQAIIRATADKQKALAEKKKPVTKNN
jgi:hypothetical protein